VDYDRLVVEWLISMEKNVASILCIVYVDRSPPLPYKFGILKKRYQPIRKVETPKSRQLRHAMVSSTLLQPAFVRLKFSFSSTLRQLCHRRVSIANPSGGRPYVEV